MNGETRLNFSQIKENYTISLKVILPEDITNNHWILHIQAKLKKSTWDPLFQNTINNDDETKWSYRKDDTASKENIKELYPPAMVSCASLIIILKS